MNRILEARAISLFYKDNNFLSTLESGSSWQPPVEEPETRLSVDVLRKNLAEAENTITQLTINHQEEVSATLPNIIKCLNVFLDTEINKGVGADDVGKQKLERKGNSHFTFDEMKTDWS